MKLVASQIRFFPLFPWLGRHRLQLVGKQNTLQLLETALVFEGHVKRFWFPVVDGFFWRVLSEWTMVTVPYSCILAHRYTSLLGSRVLLTTLFWLPVAGMLGFAAFAQGSVETTLAFAPPFSFLALVLTVYVNSRVLVSRNYLLYRHADGRNIVTSFRIRSRKRQQEFRDLLEKNRAASTRPPSTVRIVKERAPLLPLILLIACLLGRGLLAPIWLALAPPASAVPSLQAPPKGFSQRVGKRLPVQPPPPSPVALGLEDKLVRICFRFLHGELPLLLLAVLAWRWNSVVRWLAVFLLVVHGAMAVLGPTSLELLQSPADGFSFTNVASLLFHLFLALLLALQPSPRQALERGEFADA
jgi:hypothetical protein